MLFSQHVNQLEMNRRIQAHCQILKILLVERNHLEWGNKITAFHSHPSYASRDDTQREPLQCQGRMPERGSESMTLSTPVAPSFEITNCENEF
jgi:hypothetical protein